MKKAKIFALEHSLEKSFTMTISMFMNQGFIVKKKFIVKEVAMLRKGAIFSYYMSHVMKFLDKIRKVLRFLIECLSPWITMGRRDDTVQYGEMPDYDGCNWYGKK